MQILTGIRVWRPGMARRRGFLVLTDIHEIMYVLVRVADVSFCCFLFLLVDDGERRRVCGLRSQFQGTELTWILA